MAAWHGLKLANWLAHPPLLSMMGITRRREIAVDLSAPLPLVETQELLLAVIALMGEFSMRLRCSVFPIS
eukprot:scaffold250370_cov32-Tisochrysis_lutea.AAC.2